MTYMYMYMYKIYDVHTVICMHVALPWRKNWEQVAWQKGKENLFSISPELINYTIMLSASVFEINIFFLNFWF